jgi:hypothetical protein
MKATTRHPPARRTRPRLGRGAGAALAAPARRLLAERLDAAVAAPRRGPRLRRALPGRRGAVLYPFLLRDLERCPTSARSSQGLTTSRTPSGFGGPLCPHGTPEETVDRVQRGLRGVVPRAAGGGRVHPLPPAARDAPHAAAPPPDRGGRADRLASARPGRLPADRHVQRDHAQEREGGARGGPACHVETSAAAYERWATSTSTTPRRRRALPAYRFDTEHFLRLRETLGSHQTLFGVRSEGELVAGAVFLRSPDFVHFYVAGADRRSPTCAR